MNIVQNYYILVIDICQLFIHVKLKKSLDFQRYTENTKNFYKKNIL